MLCTPLYRMLLQAAGIRCLVVTGQAGEEEASWNLCSLDGKWSWTCAADGTLQKLNGEEVQDPQAADPGAWEPLRFE